MLLERLKKQARQGLEDCAEVAWVHECLRVLTVCTRAPQ